LGNEQVHHSIAVYVAIFIQMIYGPLDSLAGGLVIPLIAMHWFAMVKYYSLPLYALVNLVLEIWWEYICYSVLGKLDPDSHEHITIKWSIFIMLAAHYCFWLAPIVSLGGDTLWKDQASDPEASPKQTEEPRMTMTGGSSVQPRPSGESRRASVPHMMAATSQLRNLFSSNKAAVNVAPQPTLIPGIEHALRLGSDPEHRRSNSDVPRLDSNPEHRHSNLEQALMPTEVMELHESHKDGLEETIAVVMAATAQPTANVAATAPKLESGPWRNHIPFNLEA